ncbi:hypothetical protein JCM6882_004818 [Rhodosporidiobolus microsporus]
MARVSTVFLGMLALSWALAVPALGLSAAIVAKATGYANDEYQGVMIQSTFAWAWTTLFTTILLIGDLVAGNFFLFSPAMNFVLLFISWLQTIVSFGSFAAIQNDYGYFELGNLYKGFYGVCGAATFILMFTTVYALYQHITTRATPVPEHKETEHF